MAGAWSFGGHPFGPHTLMPQRRRRDPSGRTRCSPFTVTNPPLPAGGSR